LESGTRVWYYENIRREVYAMQNDAYQQRADAMPKDEGTIPPDSTVTSVSVTIAELVARECEWLREHAEQ
jgi:hypothetical protein